MKSIEELEQMSDVELLDYKKYCKEQSEYYMLMSTISKVSLNSLYGAISNPYCKFYSLPLAASITSTAQLIEKYQVWKSDQIVKELSS